VFLLNQTQHVYHQDTKVKPEAATAVIEFLMMGGKTPETRLAVNKRQDNKLENCCIWLVINFNNLHNYFLHNFFNRMKLKVTHTAGVFNPIYLLERQKYEALIVSPISTFEKLY
jgi:hypothetical protein